ncbi:MAG: flagellar hook-length control protein FliK [Colwellia sp.]|nr:flagellar hook-length control protein FliK [Colwellia sp.]
MPQLNILSINVSKSVDVMDENTTFTSAKRNDDFSQLVEKHLTNGHERLDERHSADKVNASREKLVQKSTQQTDKANNIRVSDTQLDDPEILATEQQELAASGKNSQKSVTELVTDSSDEQALQASEQLMSFLYKADKTLLASSESLTEQQPKSLNNTFEALPPEQPLLSSGEINSNEIISSKLDAGVSGVVKAISVDQLELVAKEQLVQGVTSKVIHYNKQLSSAEQTNNTVIQPIEQQEIPLEMAKEEGKLQKSSIDQASFDTVSQFKNTQSEFSQRVTELAQSKHIAPQEENNVTTNEVVVDKAYKTGVNGINMSTVQLSEQGISEQGISEQGISEQKISEQGISEQKISEQEVAGQKIAGKKIVQQESINAIESKQVNISQDLEQISNQKLVDLNANQVNKNTQTGAVTNNFTTNNAITDNITEQQLSKNQQQSLAQEKSFAQEKSLAQEHSSFKDLSHLNQSTESLAVGEKIVKPTKADFSANAGFTDINAQAIQATQHAFEQQSIDILNPVISTEVGQIQKTNGQLHQETIAIFRKDFTDAVKDKVMLMVSQKLQRFDISLDPPEFGNMQVRVNLQNEQASVSFIVQNQQAKEALEQNMHKLRDMLAEQGVDVGSASVEQQSKQPSNQSGNQSGNQSSNAESTNNQQGDDFLQADDMAEHTLSAKVISASANAVDYYA